MFGHGGEGTLKEFIYSILVLVIGGIVALMMTKAQLNPSIHTIGMLTIVAVGWGALMGWMPSHGFERVNLERKTKWKL
jgi:hypothetical protein